MLNLLTNIEEIEGIRTRKYLCKANNKTLKQRP